MGPTPLLGLLAGLLRLAAGVLGDCCRAAGAVAEALRAASTAKLERNYLSLRRR